MNSSVLAIENLSKVFKRRHGLTLTAVDNLDLILNIGEVVGLLGPNGAGKTTIIKCVLGLVCPTAGRITVCGWDVQRHHDKVIENTSAVLEGARNIYWRMTPRENVHFFAGLQGLKLSDYYNYTEELLERFGLVDKANEPVITLSTGMKQKVAVVCALAKQTTLVFLDEPTLGLDVETSLELRSILRELARDSKRTIVVSSHDMDVIQEVCDRVVIIKEGRIVADDTVERLIDLFRTRVYHIVLSNALPSGIRRQLDMVVSNLTFGSRGRQTELTFSLPLSMKIYQVIDLIRQGGALIETITQKEPDLEEAFLRIIRDDVELNGKPTMSRLN